MPFISWFVRKWKKDKHWCLLKANRTLCIFFCFHICNQESNSGNSQHLLMSFVSAFCLNLTRAAEFAQPWGIPQCKTCSSLHWSWLDFSCPSVLVEKSSASAWFSRLGSQSSVRKIACFICLSGFDAVIIIISLWRLYLPSHRFKILRFELNVSISEDEQELHVQTVSLWATVVFI